MHARLFTATAILLLSLFAIPTFAEERITRFESDILIQPDRSLLVTESISVIAENAAIRHGIYREFPTVYPHRNWGSLGFQEKTGFSIVSIKLDGVEVPWTLKHIKNGVRFYIGNPDTYVSQGPHLYEIQYVTTRQIARQGSVDHLNWNVNGQGWTFPAEHVSALVHLSSGESITDYTAWTGYAGSQEVAYETSQYADGSILFNTTRTLRPYEGLTVSLKLPEGLLPAPKASAFLFIKDNYLWITGLMLLLAMPLYYLRAWRKVGQDPQKGVVVADYHPVRGMSAAAHHFILNNSVSNTTFTAALLSLAVKGYIRIEQKAKKRYTLYKLTGPTTKSTNNELSPGEIIVLKHLFIANETSVELGGKYSHSIATGKNKLGQYLRSEWREAIYMQNHRYTWTGLLVGLLSLAFCGLHLSNVGFSFDNLAPLSIFFFAALAFTRFKLRPFIFGGVGLLFFYTLKSLSQTVLNIPAMISLSLLVAIIFGAFYILLKAPTPFGRKILDEIEGFKLYMATAEQHRLQLLHPPEKTPELFEQLLPYAIALGVENSWSEQFVSVFGRLEGQKEDYSPVWYQATGNSRFSASGFGSSLGNGLSGSIASASTAPSSRSGGGSGGAGGGGGGGGGGGW